ncbi:MAG: hypothetical protein ACI9CV_001017, partial [Ilumatobacter sp.]
MLKGTGRYRASFLQPSLLLSLALGDDRCDHTSFVMISADEVGDAPNTFNQVLVAEGEAEAAVAGQAESLTRNKGNLGIFEDEVGKLD